MEMADLASKNLLKLSNRTSLIARFCVGKTLDQIVGPRHHHLLIAEKHLPLLLQTQSESRLLTEVS